MLMWNVSGLSFFIAYGNLCCTLNRMSGSFDLVNIKTTGEHTCVIEASPKTYKSTRHMKCFVSVILFA